MPSTSKKQQNFFKLVNAVKRGADIPVTKKVKDTAKHMKKKQIKHYLKLLLIVDLILKALLYDVEVNKDVDS